MIRVYVLSVECLCRFLRKRYVTRCGKRTVALLCSYRARTCKCKNTRQLIGAPAGIRTPNQQIMRRFEGHQQGETKRDNPVFTESAAVKVSYILLRLSTPSRHNRAIFKVQIPLIVFLRHVDGVISETPNGPRIKAAY